MGGIDLRPVQALMGHKTIAMTCRYAHLAPTCQLAAVERLADMNRAIQAGKRRSQLTPELTPAVSVRFQNIRSAQRKLF